MKITENEMRGLLAGKCLPSDILVGENLAAYLVRKFAALQQKLDAALEKVESLEEDRRTNLSIKLNMVSENGALKAWADIRSRSDDALEQEMYNSIKIDWRQRELAKIKTPATDAYLNSVRAEGVEILAENLATPDPELANGTNAINKAVAWYARQFAAKLRAGQEAK